MKISKIKDFLKQLICLLLLFLLLAWSISSNSLNYQITTNSQKISVRILGQTINFPSEGSAEPLEIFLNPQTRYSTPQYLTLNKGFLLNGCQIISLLFSRKSPWLTKYQQPADSSLNYFHFNPFRTALNINQGKFFYRLEINIPDASLEVWKENTKLERKIINPPWLKLTILPLLSSLVGAAILFQLILFLNRKITLNPTERFKSKSTSIVACLVFFLGTITIGFTFLKIFKAMPGFGDEMNYLIQAKIFASGKVFVKEPLMPEFFKVSWMDIFGADGKLWNFHPPGNSLLLAIGWLLGKNWITVPLVGGLILLSFYLIAFELFSQPSIAVLAVLITLTSHYFLSLASSFMAHAPCLLFISLSYLFIIKFFKNRNQHYLVPASFFMGLAFIIRPLSAVLSTIVPALAILYFLLKSRKIDYFHLFFVLIVGLLTSSIIFIYSYFITGRWTLPYLIKGPEVGLTLFVRLGKELNYHLTNLYRNQNEFQNRIYSLGIFFNYLFFLFPLFFIKRDKNKLFILGGYLSFWFYLIGYSFLHWYGWKWEPRMIYEISFIFFILSAYGLGIFYQNTKQIKTAKYATILFGLVIFLRTAFVDLPYRFKTEYKNYNFTPTGVRDTIAKRKISNAIIFFANEFLFAPYSPDNSLTFDGNIIYAIFQGDDYNYRLISKFPEKKVFFSPDAQTLVEKPNFYRNDVQKLAKDLITNYQNYEIITIIPWLKTAETNLNTPLPGKKVDQGEFITLLKNNFANANTKNRTLLVLIGQSTNLAEVVKNLYSNSLVINKNEYETPIKYQVIDLNSKVSLSSAPGIKMTCYDGTNWDGGIIKQETVGNIEASQCYGNYRSIIWETNFNLLKPEKATFFLDSDDGSVIIINGNVVVDNNLFETHGMERKTGIVDLHKGENNLKIKYFNGPGIGFINAGILNQTGQEKKISIDSFFPYLHL